MTCVGEKLGEVTLSIQELEPGKFIENIADLELLQGLENFPWKPVEQCGVVFSSIDYDYLLVIKVPNRAKNKVTNFEIYLTDKIKVEEELNIKNWDVVGVLHTHVSTTNLPSDEDWEDLNPPLIYFIWNPYTKILTRYWKEDQLGEGKS